MKSKTTRVSSFLNEEQQRAATAPLGPVLVLAGAGTGKTRALIARVAYLIEEAGAVPESILIVTFTNKAADKLRERLMEMLGQTQTLPWAGTFHSFCARLLRQEGHLLGFQQDFTIYDTDDSKRLLAEILREKGIPREELPPVLLQNWISAWKNGRQDSPPKRDSRRRLLPELLKLYQTNLRQSQSMDFDDLLLYPVELFRAAPKVLSRIQEKYRHILIDEYQDTNRPQYELASMLASKHCSLFAVGDDDQSIYQWRGADLRNILEFEQDYPDAVVCRLEQNYRSTEAILRVANDVIVRNRARKPKEIWTALKGGEKAVLRPCRTDLDEAREVVGEIFHRARRLKIPWKSFAVLYRTNAQSRPFEEILISQTIPYSLVGAIRFYDRKEIKDALSYLRVIINPADELSLRRAFSVPTRGIGLKSIQRLDEAAREWKCTLAEAMARVDEIPKMTAITKIRLKAMHDLLCSCREKTEKLPLPRLISEVIIESGLRPRLEEEGTDEARNRLENLEQLVAAAQQRCRSNPAMTLGDFLQEVALIADVDDWQDKDDTVTLMTLHAAKGLEFPTVFIVGLEEGLFPHERSSASEADIEEERRLFYVGVTRARENLYLTYAGQRWQGGSISKSEPSRFLREIHPENLQGWTLPKDKKDTEPPWWSDDERGVMPVRSRGRTTDRRKTRLPVETSLLYRIGDWVEHPKFGRGVVTAKSGDLSNLKLRVAFEGIGSKLLAVKFASLKKIDR